MEQNSSFDLELVDEACAQAGNMNLIAETEAGLETFGIPRQLDKSAHYKVLDWLLEVVAFQGISDKIARRYLEQHDRISSVEVARQLEWASCRKLSSHWSFEGCGYQKEKCRCANQHLMANCPLPRHDLRNGRLNQTAYSIALFARDIADNDLIGWIDRQLEQAEVAAGDGQEIRWSSLRRALLDPLGNIYGVGEKVLSMALSDLLLGGCKGRPLWLETGACLIAVDSLVHNWLHRTGLIARWGIEHPYGAKCYGSDGCAAAIERLAVQLDARRFNPTFPQAFPRFVQKAIWSFCAGEEYGRCNGNRINDAIGCDDEDCPLGWWCERRPLRADN